MRLSSAAVLALTLTFAPPAHAAPAGATPGVAATTAPAEAAAPDASPAVAGALRALLAAEATPAALDEVYRARADRPLWVEAGQPTEEAQAALRRLQAASQDGLRAQAYGTEALAQALAAAKGGEPQALARFELSLSRALGDFAADLRTPKDAAAPAFTDRDFQPPADLRAAAWRAAAAAPAGSRLAALTRMNPIYQSLKAAYAAALPGTDTARLALANMDRVRALPAELGPRFLLVDVAAQRLWMFAAGSPPESMKVVVGRRTAATPPLVGLVRNAVFRPYWEVPPDLAQERAQKVLASGPSYLAAENIEALSDNSAQARILALDAVDWRAAASDGQAVRLRQKPGPKNMMGQVKFAFPNNLGIVLHDSPLRWLFDQPQRTASAGCVRLEDAPRLARWLLGAERADAALAQGPAEDAVALAAPVPVYILYLTAAPADGPLGAGPLKARADVYRRDGPGVAPTVVKVKASTKRASAGGGRRLG
jgi:murein L,D-transpeptidase YcbB/YkuD